MAKQNLKERLKKKAKDLKERGSKGNMIFIKADTTYRVRILYMGEEEEFIQEVTQFYLGSEIKGVMSPDTFGEPCAIMDAYKELKESQDDDDKELAKKFPPRNRYLAFVATYKDDRGKEIDEQNSEKFIMLTPGIYQDILDLYLDEDEWGDMTDPKNGYDIKISRTGSGKTDTEYTVKPCKNTPTPKPYNKKVYNMDKEIRKIIPSFEETEELRDKFLGLTNDDTDTKPEKKKLKKKKLKKKGKSGPGEDDLPF